jgi:hypothetical protein
MKGRKSSDLLDAFNLRIPLWNICSILSSVRPKDLAITYLGVCF